MEFMIKWTHSRLVASNSCLTFTTLYQITLFWTVVLASLGYVCETRSQGEWLDQWTCPFVYNHMFQGYAPKGNLKINTYTAQPDAKGDLVKCIESCCEDSSESGWESESSEGGTVRAGYDSKEVCRGCNGVILVKGQCYHVCCESNAQCQPVKSKNSKDVIMVLVKPKTEGGETPRWEDVLGLPSLKAGPRREPQKGIDIQDNFLENTKQSGNSGIVISPLISHGRERECVVGAESESCDPGELCIPIVRGGHSSARGYCMCSQGSHSTDCILQGDRGHKAGDDDRGLYDEGIGGSSVQVSTADPSKPQSQVLEDFPGDSVGFGLPSVDSAQPQSKTSTTSPPPKTLEVSVLNHTLCLPENEVTLSAYVIPSPKPGEHYSYEWTLLSRPGGDEAADTGTMQDKNGPNLKLGNLREGFYSFQVVVNGPDSIGKQVANVTVLPPKRKNRPPVAKVTPLTQIVRLPNTGAVLDGSGSLDDDKIVSYRWELQQGPLEYQPHLPATSTLQLDNLTLPGNYTFKLTVVDSDHESSSAVGKIEVVKERDYPPVANAGQDVIVYLPHKSVTLYGNRSTDDRGILSWEWTKSPGDKAVDMQNTRTPFLELSNLEEGMYTFALRVTDSSGQNSTADVHVFVKPPTKKPPVANAGGNSSISLPKTWYILDGSKSSDDVAIIDWHWEQLSGPSKAIFIGLPAEKKEGANGAASAASPGTGSDAVGKFQNGSSLPSSASDDKGINGMKVNATALTKGTYLFRLTVTDGDGNKASENVSITVNQPVNAPPKADAGGDHTVVAGEGGPGWLIVADGRHSSDDLAIVSWRWTREPSGLAAGKVVGDSDHSPVLKVVDAVPGRYVFTLRVTDEQGAFSDDTVSIIVKPDPKLLSLVEVWLNVDAGRLTAAQLAGLEARLALLLPHPSVPRLVDLRPDSASGRTVLVFYAQEDRKASISNGAEGNGKDTESNQGNFSKDGIFMGYKSPVQYTGTGKN